MIHVIVGFSGQQGAIDGGAVTARGLHGLFYTVLKQFNAAGATWLHKHESPKPYSLAPYYSEEGCLLGLRVAALTERAEALVWGAWTQAHERQTALYLGQQGLRVRAVETLPGPGFAELADSSSETRLGLRFLAPTAFKQGPGMLPLPLPRNVFAWPLRVWARYAPGVVALPDDWLAWCERDVFVTAHRLETADVRLDKWKVFTGFVGEVGFTALSNRRRYLHGWQALAGLAAFCGVGYKTTMGMGAVERL